MFYLFYDKWSNKSVKHILSRIRSIHHKRSPSKYIEFHSTQTVAYHPAWTAFPMFHCTDWWLWLIAHSCANHMLTWKLLHTPYNHSCQVGLLYATLGFFICKVVGKNPWSRFFGLILGLQSIANQCNNISAVGNLPNVPPPHWRKNTFRKKVHDAVIQAMIEVDVEEWDDFLLALIFTTFL